MFGLTSIGTLHTAFGLVALISAFTMLVRHGDITTRRPLAMVYIVCTAITCITGFGIFQRGGFNIAHVLGVMTLIVLAAATLAGKRQAFGGLSSYVETLGFTTTVFFHMIPGITETFSRFPRSGPLFTGPEDPTLAKVIGIVFLFYLIGATLQYRRLRHGGQGAVSSLA
ncbi:MAG: hypothetical protein REI94_03105 [Moraxellaceae bacterium]|nr:hypothetical protein [Moraxellaceae bacterium]